MKYDKNGHKINWDGSLAFDEFCEECRKQAKEVRREDSHETKAIKEILWTTVGLLGWAWMLWRLYFFK